MRITNHVDQNLHIMNSKTMINSISILPVTCYTRALLGGAFLAIMERDAVASMARTAC